MPVQFEKWFRVDLNKKAMTEWIGNGLFTNDNLSNLIGVELYDGLTPIDIPGNVEGILILPNGGTLTINGSHEGNRAWIELPETALSLEGLIVITIKTIINDRKVTLVQCSGRVVATETGLVIDPDDIVPKDVTEFMAMLDDLRDLIDGYSDIIMVQDTQPDSETNKLWLLKTPDTGIQIPTMDDLNSVSSDISSLAEDVADIQSDLADAIESIETLETTTEGLSDSVADLEEEVANKADIDGYYTDMTVGAAEQVVSSTMVEDNAPYKLRTSGGSTDIGNRAYVDKIVGGTVAWNQQVRDAASENVTEYADVVTVTDAVEDDAAVSVRLEPVQDLHGYDSPWPAGGGANKFDALTWVTLGTNSNFYSVSADETITVLQNDASGISNRLLDVDAGEQYSFLSTFVQSIRIFSSDSQTIAQTSNGTFTAPSDGKIAVKFYASAYPTSGQFILVKGSTVPSAWSPYSNICPISGFDSVKVGRTGKNLLDDSIKAVFGSRLLIGATSIYDNPTYLKAGTYSITVFGINQTFAYLMKSQNSLKMIVNGTNHGSFTVDNDGYYRIDLYGNIAISGDVTGVILVPGSTYATAYEPYQGNTYTITLPQTVYKGTVGSDGGKNMSGMFVFDGVNVQGNIVSTSYITDTVTRAYYQVRNVNIPQTPYPQRVTKCNCAVYNVAIVDNTQTYYVANSGQNLEINVRLLNSLTGITTSDTEAEAKAKWNAYVAEHPIQVYYETVTPTQFSIILPQITTLLGTNHVWSDAGQLSLTYTGTDEYLVLTTGRKYLTRINGTDSMVLGAGQEVTAVKGRDNVFDLTQMFGTAVADYVYQQGTGYFRKWFGASWYAYNAGELISVQGVQSRDVVGFNQWDEQWESGQYIGNTSTGVIGIASDSTRIRSKNDIAVLPDTTYYLKSNQPLFAYYLDANGTWLNVVGSNGTTLAKNSVFTTPADCRYMKFFTINTSVYNHDICINLSHNGTRNGEYEPYTHRSYPLDSTLTLRGIPKVGSNGVYWDGDEYGYDGGVKRRYGMVDMGTLEWAYDASDTYAGNPYFATGSIDTRKVGSSNIICLKYQTKDGGRGSIPNKAIASWNTTTASAVAIRDDSYTDAAAFKASLSGVYLVYELATPTTETATPYQQIQSVDDWGTEEFVSSTITPVGHQSRYPQNLRDKLQHLPALASANGSYIITQTDGQMVLSPFPAPPTAAGNYLLKATVSGGNATYSWVAQ